MQTQTDKRKEATGNQEDIEKATEFDLSALKKSRPVCKSPGKCLT